MNSEHKKLIRLAEKLLYVRADTDMISCYCGSVYSLGDRQLVVAPITAEEFSNGLFGYLDKRINAIYPTHDYKFYKYVDKVCPFCGKYGTQNLGKERSIKEYCTLHPNTLIIYTDKTIRILKEEIDASYD